MKTYLWRVVRLTDVNARDVWFVEDSQHYKVAGPFLTEAIAQLRLRIAQR